MGRKHKSWGLRFKHIKRDFEFTEDGKREVKHPHLQLSKEIDSNPIGGVGINNVFESNTLRRSDMMELKLKSIKLGMSVSEKEINKELKALKGVVSAVNVLQRGLAWDMVVFYEPSQELSVLRVKVLGLGFGGGMDKKINKELAVLQGELVDVKIIKSGFAMFAVIFFEVMNS